MQNNKKFISNDRFGQPYQVVGCKPNKNNADFCAGYAELGGKLYKIEPSKAEKEGVTAWVKITLVKKRPTSSSM